MTVVVGFTLTAAGRAALLAAAEEVLDVLDKVSARLGVIDLRRPSAVSKMLLGSNAHRILMDAHCPVLTVKADQDG
jgi:Universal stress protein family